jgi:hypothetical protein
VSLLEAENPPIRFAILPEEQTITARVTITFAVAP